MCNSITNYYFTVRPLLSLYVDLLRLKHNLVFIYQQNTVLAATGSKVRALPRKGHKLDPFRRSLDKALPIFCSVVLWQFCRENAAHTELKIYSISVGNAKGQKYFNNNEEASSGT